MNGSSKIWPAAAPLCLALAMATAAHSAPSKSPPQKPKDVEAILAQLGASTIRGVQSDICYPATAEEYEAMGKNGVLMLTASSALSTELPLKSAYLEVKGLRAPLQRVALFDKRQTVSGSDGDARTEQVSFYLIPLSLLAQATSLDVDFTGERKSFGVQHFEKGKAFSNAPAFVRLDEYNSPSEPDLDAVHALLVREYPDYFRD